jgi:hypothetical protein
MAEEKAKKKLEEVSAKMGNKITADTFLKLFKNNQNKYSNEKLFEFLKNHIKVHILDGGNNLIELSHIDLHFNAISMIFFR